MTALSIAEQGDGAGSAIAADTASALSSDGLSLWYRQAARQWTEALPIGNGRLGAMVFGGVPEERLQLNESTLWGGGPHDYDNPEALAALPEIRELVFAGKWAEAQTLINAKFVGRPVGQMPYQTVGDLLLSFHPSVSATDTVEVTDYRRDLDLETAITSVSYRIGNVRYAREAFVSAVDQAIVLRITADQPGAISFSAAFHSPQTSEATVSSDGRTLMLGGIGGDAGGIAGAVKFHALARVLTDGGQAHGSAAHLIIAGANSATLLISIATGYRSYKDVGGDSEAFARAFLDVASRKSYARLRAAHIANYGALFNRVKLDLGTSPAQDRPTDERVRAFKDVHDPRLAVLHFQFGRYLLISSSRPGGQPATLQGLWNDSVTPPWGSKYTVNINTEMNYWPAGPANLLECYEPLFGLIDDLAMTGARTARDHYGAKGWVTHHNTDAWRGTAPVDGAFWGMWPTGGAWLCKSIWDHYAFTGDSKALARHYPSMKGAAVFFLDTLVEDPVHHHLVTNPSVSPENAHHPDVSACAGPTMDMQILRDLFETCAKASEILGIDGDFRERALAARAKLAPMKIGHLGQLQEWQDDWDAGAPEQDHRHVSHLYGLYPSRQITRRGTPDLFAAAKKSLETRGDMATGWSLAWKINLWARLEDGDHAYKLLTNLLTPEHTAPNLFDLHPPFQIDGNFGATSGLCEMLLQSHADEIHLLPALPSVWPSGSVSGLRARGGHTVDLRWSGGRLTEAVVHPGGNGEFAVRYGEQVVRLHGEAGAAVQFVPVAGPASSPVVNDRPALKDRS